MTIGVAVIGAGMMGGDHARRIGSEIAGARLAALVDLDVDRARAVAAEVNGDVLVTSDALAALDHESVDAVIIASHDSTHAELILAGIERGQPVLCEKPLAPTEAECQAVIDREVEYQAEHGRRLVSVGFMRRFDAGCLRLHAAVANEEFGQALMVHCLHRNVDPYPGGSDHTITGSAVHEFDFVPWLLGSPISEVAWLSGRSSSRTARIDPQLLLIRTADGVLTTLEMFISAEYGYEVGCETVFEHGTLRLTEPALIEVRAQRTAGIGFPADSLPRYSAAYRVELQAWVDSIAAGGDPDPRLANAWDGLLATRAADAMVKAMEAGDGRFLPLDALEAPAIYRDTVSA
ncbi:Gfo/Idh/MocA family oxidoreductase [Microbacterium oleivorans]|uniref:Gfo/Idh/MocA family oxidoreductase n=1 Tax=Microbacterium oleivorans TaxID=273677 RepID=A0A7D5EXY1_9MICO|nr:Gfo/Idh/MocA family oxidoreductase [Microbacterium oleivorans]QLD12766.1 Gfo/Idh/MocA family oxidoreductase [Microbacterium oleivorans]